MFLEIFLTKVHINHEFLTVTIYLEIYILDVS